MEDQDWLAANSGTGLDIAEQYIAEAKATRGPLEAIGRYLLAIDVMRIHIGRMDTESELVKMSLAQTARQSAWRPKSAFPGA